ncbi:MAG TPA: hypothetical protein VJG83_01830 [archaeon]|nr:hypothetical protein [archaeon]
MGSYKIRTHTPLPESMFTTVASFNEFLVHESQFYPYQLGTRRKTVNISPKVVALAIFAYLNENMGAKSGMEVTDKIIADLRKSGFVANSESLNKMVTPEFRSIHHDSGWGGNKKVKPTAKRKDKAGVKDKSIPALTDDERLRANNAFKQFVAKREKKMSSAIPPSQFRKKVFVKFVPRRPR